jgi:hypothetical protein
MTFIAELRRRNVIRTAGLYLVGAWLLTQVSSTVLPTFDVPSWVLRALIIVLAIGFDRVIARDPTYSPAHRSCVRARYRRWRASLKPEVAFAQD